jgi:hypothetical protein
MRRPLVTVFLVIAMLMSGLAEAGHVAADSSGPIFTVMNTSETLPDGVWFRTAPYTADAIRVTGDGVYMGEQVQLQCYAFGQTVGQYNDSLWYYSQNIPARPSTGWTTSGT